MNTLCISYPDVFKEALTLPPPPFSTTHAADQMIAEVPPRRQTQSLVTHRPHPFSSKSDTSFLSEDPPLPPSSQSFDNLSYMEVDHGQREEFEKMLKNVSIVSKTYAVLFLLAKTIT